MKRAAFIIVAGVLACNSLLAQLSKEDYKKQADEVRKEVWGWNIKQFSNLVVPDSMKKYSYVVLARHQEVIASSRRLFAIALNAHKERILVRTFRQRLKLQDKAALEEYSYINYTAFEGHKSSLLKSMVVSIVGVKITKPNGTTKEVNADETVFTSDEKTNREARLAIPDLEVGDILDYFIQIYDKDKGIALPDPTPLDLLVADEVPVLHYSIHGQISKKYAFEYKCINGAPNLKIEDKDDEWEFNAEVNDLTARPVGLWFSSFRQLPMIRLNLVPSGTPGINDRQRPGHLNNAVKIEDLVADISLNIRRVGPYFGTPVKYIKDLLKSYTKVHGKIPDDSLAFYVYYAERFYKRGYYWNKPTSLYGIGFSANKPEINENLFALQLCQLFRIMRIDAELLIVPSKYGPDETRALTINDFMYVVRTSRPATTYFSKETIFTNPGEIPYQYERENTFNVIDNNNITAIRIPAETATQNKHQEYIRLTFDGNDLSQANVKRTTTLSGHFRADEQIKMLLYEDLEKNECARFGYPNIFEKMDESKKIKTLADDFRQAMQKSRESLKDVFTKDITEQFGDKPTGAVTGRVTQPGTHHDSSSMIYETEFKLNNVTKKAGNNYLLNIGVLIGSQLDIKPEQRKRTDDVYMPHARSFMNIIEVDIPEGYQLEGLENINVKVDNETGWFSCKATIENKKLMLKVEKGYRKSFMKADEFPALLEMLDKAVALREQKLLLKKI